MRILVTGGAGFVGSAVRRHLVRDTQHEVVNPDKLTSAAYLSSPAPIANSPRYRFVKGDIADGALVRRVREEHAIDSATHLAAERRAVHRRTGGVRRDQRPRHLPAPRGGAVEDHARAAELVVTRGERGRSYNVGGGNERSELEVVHAICDANDRLRPGAARRREPIRFVADRPDHDLRDAIDASRIEAELGWRAQETFETGLLRTAEWYLADEPWWRPIRDGRHKGERLGAWA